MQTLVLLCLLFGIAIGSSKTSSVDQVHVVFSNHLDIGFDGIDPITGFAVNVINKYFTVYFPRALATAKAMRAANGTKYIWTTQPWLLAVYLDCENSGIPSVGKLSVKCPTAAEKQNVVDGLRRGEIAYHAFPFNGEPEIFGSGAEIEAAVAMTRSLDAMLGKPDTVTLSQRDVPGMTRSVLPWLARNGVRAISVGVNGGSAPPAVPKIFRWTNQASTSNLTDVAELLALWHPGGYGGVTLDDCVTIPGFNQALCMAWNGDNKGPQTPDQANAWLAQIQAEFGPQARVSASTFDQFVLAVLDNQHVYDALPLVTQEIGDTWIYGCASDPLKLMTMRALGRARAAYLEHNPRPSLARQDALAMERFDRLYLKTFEHTWGLDVKTFLHDFGNWTNRAFEHDRAHPNFHLMETSWKEQRAYILAARMVAPSELQELVAQEMALLAPPWGIVNDSPSSMGFTKLASPGSPIAVGPPGGRQLMLAFNSTGALVAAHWTSEHSAAVHSLDDGGQLQFSYATYDHSDYVDFLSDYRYVYGSWINKDFGKPNVSLGDAQHRVVLPRVQGVWTKNLHSVEEFTILLDMTLDSDVHQTAGAPARVRAVLTAADVTTGHEPAPTVSLDYKLVLINKTSTRLPEAAFVSLNARSATPSPWTIQKLQGAVVPGPERVVLNGSVHLHAADLSGLVYSYNTECYSYDAPLAVFGAPSPFPTPLAGNTVSGNDYAARFMLFNNAWGTNYVMWYPFSKEEDPSDADIQYRFKIVLKNQS